MARRFAAELFGTLVLVFFGCGAAVLGGFEIIGRTVMKWRAQGK